MGGTRVPREDDARTDADDERRMMGAMLIAVGDLGFSGATVQDALDLTDVSRKRFYERFSNKGDCFARAYDIEAEALCRRILSAAHSAGGWVDGLRAGVSELLRFVADKPAAARALLIEGQHARGPTSSKYDEVAERLSHAIDSARHRVGTQHAPPPLTARFIVATIESTVSGWLLGDTASDAMSLLPGLVHFSVLYYLGEEAALRALDGT
jgi:AcrR family transcriptional regulator